MNKVIWLLVALLVIVAWLPAGIGPAVAQEVTPTAIPASLFPWFVPTPGIVPTTEALPTATAGPPADPSPTSIATAVSTATAAPVAESSPTPVATAAPAPADSGLRPIALAGWIRIVELTPTLGDEIAANGRIWVVFEHQIAGIPEGWRLGFRAYGDYTMRDGRRCEDCYLAEGLFGNNRGYISGRATVTWTSRPDVDVRYQVIQLCITAIDPATSEIRISNLCEERRAG